MGDYYSVYKEAKEFLAQPDNDHAFLFMLEAVACLDNNWYNPRVRNVGSVGFPCSVCPWTAHEKEKGFYCKLKEWGKEFESVKRDQASPAVAKALEMATILVAEYQL